MKKEIIKKEEYKFKHTERCIRCGRRLKTEESKAVGFGPTCYKKFIKEKSSKYKNRRLF